MIGSAEKNFTRRDAEARRKAKHCRRSTQINARSEDVDANEREGSRKIQLNRFLPQRLKPHIFLVPYRRHKCLLHPVIAGSIHEVEKHECPLHP